MEILKALVIAFSIVYFFLLFCYKRDKELYVPEQDAKEPAVPGPDDLYNVSEMAFHNGEQHMKEKIIARLMEHKTQVKGVCHAHVVEIIQMVEGM